MKKLLLIPMLLPCFANAQVLVDRVNVNDLENVHILVVAIASRALSSKLNVTIDYGQNRSVKRSCALTNERGEPKVFYSIAAVLNYMEQNGWKYVDSNDNDPEGYAYIFKRKE